MNEERNKYALLTRVIYWLGDEVLPQRVKIIAKLWLPLGTLPFFFSHSDFFVAACFVTTPFLNPKSSWQWRPTLYRPCLFAWDRTAPLKAAKKNACKATVKQDTPLIQLIHNLLSQTLHESNKSSKSNINLVPFHFEENICPGIYHFPQPRWKT